MEEPRDGGGAEGNRTPDLLIANEALYQLSYSPIPRVAAAPVARGRRRARTMLMTPSEVKRGRLILSRSAGDIAGHATGS